MDPIQDVLAKLARVPPWDTFRGGAELRVGKAQSYLVVESVNIYSKFVKHISYQLVHAREGIRGVYGHLAELEETQWFSRDEVVSIQMNRLSVLLDHAYRNTAYYRRVFDRLGVAPNEIRTVDELAQLPVLTKEIIRSHANELKATNLRADQFHSSASGGTSGVKMSFVRDNACLARKIAATIRHERWTGWDIGQRRGVIWPAAQDYVGHWGWKAKLRNELYKREVVLPAAVLDDASIGAYLAEVSRKRPRLIRGFATPLCLVAQYLDRHREMKYHTDAVVSTGEPLYPHQRSLIGRAFSTTVYDSYGAREVALVAQECEAHSGMHVNAENVIVEAVGPVIDGQQKLLVTDLWNFGMPFIRYDIGDMGSLLDQSCPCGRGLPLMGVGVGREADVMFSTEGRAISPGAIVLYLVDNGPEVGQVQIEQDALDHLIVWMTPDPEPDESVFGHYRHAIAELFGSRMRVTFELVEDVPTETSGKYKFARCTIPGEQRPS